MKRSTIWTIIAIVAALAAAGAALYLLLRAKKQQECCCICDTDEDILFDMQEYDADPEVAEVFEEVADGE